MLEASFAAAASGGDLVWLDSAIGDADRGRRSVLAVALAPAIELHDGSVALWNRRGQRTIVPTPRPFEVADQAFRSDRRRAPEPGLGWVGYVAFEAARLADVGMPERAFELPFPLARFDRVVAAIVADRDGVRVLAEDDAGRARAEALLDAAPRALPPIALSRVEDPEPQWHQDRVREIIAEIHAGRVYQACYTLPLWYRRPEAMGDVYRALRRVNPGDFGAFLRLGGLEAASVSPERFLQLDGRDVTARPMKGTRARVAGREDADAAELAASDKDRAENVMIVDLVRNDLNRVCVPGSVHVPELFAVERYATVLQMTSTVRGTLRDDVGPFGLLAATFPPGSMTGAPKIEACRLLNALEPSPRGLYSGTIGWLGYDGRASFSVVIRTLQAYADVARWDVGGGIVADSDPVAEWEEAMTKAAPVRALEG